MPVEKNCLICNKIYYCKPIHAEISKYCSNACRHVGKSLFHSGENHENFVKDAIREKNCHLCGKEFKQRKKEPLCSFTKRKFCCRECQDEGQQRLYGENHPNWNPDRIRASRGREATAWGNKVKIRDDYKCVMCGKSEGELHAHHLKSWLEYPDLRLDVENGITVCPPCHWKIHTAKDENSVNSVKLLTGNAEDNTEPSVWRKPTEGVTTRGRVYRRWFGFCDWCKIEITKTYSDTVGKKHLFCSRTCAGKHQRKTYGNIRKPKSMTVISPTSAGHESEEIV